MPGFNTFKIVLTSKTVKEEDLTGGHKMKVGMKNTFASGEGWFFKKEKR